MRDKKWKEAVAISESESLNLNSDHLSFRFWYLRAVGQCALLELNGCAASFEKAKSLASDQYRSSVEKMQAFLSLFDRPNEGSNDSILI